MPERIIAIAWKVLILMCIPAFIIGLMTIINPALFGTLVSLFE